MAKWLEVELQEWAIDWLGNYFRMRLFSGEYFSGSLSVRTCVIGEMPCVRLFLFFCSQAISVLIN